MADLIQRQVAVIWAAVQQADDFQLEQSLRYLETLLYLERMSEYTPKLEQLRRG